MSGATTQVQPDGTVSWRNLSGPELVARLRAVVRQGDHGAQFRMDLTAVALLLAELDRRDAQLAQFEARLGRMVSATDDAITRFRKVAEDQKRLAEKAVAKCASTMRGVRVSIGAMAVFTTGQLIVMLIGWLA